MIERWRRPLRVLDVRHHDTEQILLLDGRRQRNTTVVYDRDSTERIRSGMACAKCLEVFPEAWPELCPVCGAPIRARQLEYFQREYAGIERLGSRVSLEEEAATISERIEEETR